MTSPRSSTFGVVALVVITLAPEALAATGDPVPNVDVALERKPGRMIRQVKTDLQGNFSFGFVHEGDYVITVRPGTTAVPRPVGANANATAPGSASRVHLESRSDPVATGGSNPLQFQVIVNGTGTGPVMRTMRSDAAQEMQVTTSGGQLGGRIIAQ